MISVKINITIVKTTDTTVKYSSPQRICACAPTPAAPMVCAKVFTVKIAERGLSMLLLKSCSFLPNFGLSLLTILTCDAVMLKSAASIKEQIKDITNARSEEHTSELQ